jgi:hypothetical protein
MAVVLARNASSPAVQRSSRQSRNHVYQGWAGLLLALSHPSVLALTVTPLAASIVVHVGMQ